MRSSLPKVLHTLAGQPLLQHVIDTAQALDPSQIHVVVGYGADVVQEAVPGQKLNFHTQNEQLGTGHAVGCALPACQPGSVVLVLFGDVPLIASGGAGCMQDFQDVLTDTNSSGALAASVFHKNLIFINELKEFLLNQSINIRV